MVSNRAYAAGLVSLGALAAAAAVLVNAWLFPLYSLNRDDSVYIAMARLIQDGHVTLPAAGQEAFRPWASGQVGGRFVLKYTPPWPAILAGAELITGSPRAGLAATAAATVVLTALLTAEVLRNRVTGLVAGALLLLSPAFLVQSGTYLPYLFELACGLGFALLLLTGARRRSTSRVVAAGVVIGLAAWARPFDAVLIALPFTALVALAAARARRRGCPVRSNTVALLARLAAGAMPLVAVILAYNAVVLGDPLRLPYTVTGASDGFGFGRRGVFPQYTIEFTPADGVSGVLANLRWLPSWIAGGVVLVALAVFGLVRATGRARFALASLTLVVPVGYLFFWGPYAMSSQWSGVRLFGPFYLLPVMVPLVALGASGLVRLVAAGAGRRRWARPFAVAVVVAMAALTAMAVPDKVSGNLAVRDDFRALQRFVEEQDLERAVLILPFRGDLGFESTTPFLENRPSLDQRVLYAEDRGTRNFDLVDQHPDRKIYRLTQELPAGRPTGGSLTMDRLKVESGPTLPIALRIDDPGPGRSASAYVTIDGAEVGSHDLAAGPGGRSDVTWTLTAESAGVPAAGAAIVLPAVPCGGVLAVGVDIRTADRPFSPGQRWERRIAYRVVDDGTRIELLRPGQGWFSNDAKGGGWVPAATDNPVHELAAPAR
ncbi:MAG: hypothetical protein JWN20_2315 [Jatrophihabitantaceae bacterium]|nr:hypothetical protein [Jatrophihabitantaceae bacterium]